MESHVATFHGSVYGKKATRKEADLPADLTNASAATRRVYEPTVSAAKLSAAHRRLAVGTLQNCLYAVHRHNMLPWLQQQATEESCTQAH